MEHLFLKCPIARLIWNIVSCVFDSKPIQNIHHLFGRWLQDFQKKIKTLWWWKLQLLFGLYGSSEMLHVCFRVDICCLLLDQSLVHFVEIGGRTRKASVGAALLKTVVADFYNTRFGWNSYVMRLQGVG